MRIRWRGLELPNRVVSDRHTLTDTYGKFTAEPFERPDERCLRGIGRIRVAAQNPERYPEKHPLVTVDQDLEGLGLTRERPRHEGGVVWVLHEIHCR